MTRALAVAALILSAGMARADDLPSGCRPRATAGEHALTPEAADRLRALPGTTRGPQADEFHLADGRVLVQEEEGDAGTLFTPEAYRRWRAELADELKLRRVAAGESFHALRGFIDDAGAFVAEVPALVGALHHRIGPDAELSPVAIAQLAARWRDARCRPDPALFREVTAALGDLALRRAGGGRWVTKPGDGAVEPLVEITVGGEARTLAPWRWTQALLDDGADPADLLDAALALPARADKPALVDESKAPAEKAPVSASATGTPTE